MDEPVVSLESFYALKTGHIPGPPGGGKFLGFVGGSAHLRVVPAGNINIPSGFLEAADPFVDLGIRRPIFVPAGTFPVFVTITDLSEEQDRSYERNAYLSVVFNDGEPATVLRSTTKWVSRCGCPSMRDRCAFAITGRPGGKTRSQ